ncbi:NAD(P)-dependent oxidoreductase [Vibrio sp. HN007]|uniref:NAD(P)-dependent oxidoreductase n=1 Tax=Vibrio iocasae TaxID=3098914 RepID=UPI0035D40FA1
MKILLLGANGKTGREIIARALSAGDSITALVRTEDRLADITHSKLNVYVGDVCNANTLKEIVDGHDVVISTLGPRTPTQVACKIYSEGTRAIVDAMRGSEVARLIVTSTALLFPRNTLVDKALGTIARNNVRHAAEMEHIVQSSALDWTVVRLGFLNNKVSEEAKVYENIMPKGGRSISRGAVAQFILDEAKQPAHHQKVIGLATK